ncbi:MAG: sporulation protein YqfD [Tuberibacillus sp.]
MKKSWNEKLFGHVRATIRGRVPEAFINRCVKESISIWDIKRHDQTTMSCSLMVKDIRKLKPILKATDCRIHFVGRKGFPFFVQRLLSRSGIIAGILFALAIIFILSNMVWKIEVIGADPQVEQQIRSFLKKMNVHVGSIEFFLPPIENIEGELAGEIKKATWVGVSKDGTTYHIEIVQKELPQQEEVTGPRDLIAAKEAKIRKVYVEKGLAAVETDQVVEPGQLLVSGAIGQEDDPKFVSAKGKILGETWYHSKVEIPLKTEYTTFTGNTYKRHTINLFHWNIPIWGLNSKPYEKAHKEVDIKPFHFLFWDLPFSYEKITYREIDTTHRQLDEREAVTLGKSTAKQQLLQKLPEDSKILTENVRQKTVKDGVLRLTILFTVEEDITKPRSIIPSERLKQIQEKKEKEKEKEKWATPSN